MRHAALPVLAALALGGSASAQFLIMPNSTTDQLMTFSTVDGSIINPNLFAIPNTTQVSAIDVNGEIWISAQTSDTVTRYDIAGNVLGVIGPTFTGGGLDNIRGMAFVNGNVYVTNSGTANGAPGNAIVVFDTTGTFVSSFTTQALATSPFSVLDFQGDVLVAGSSNADDVHRFTLAGVPLGTFHNSTTIQFAHQLARASDGNVWCAGFTTGGISKLDAATGAILFSFPASGARGVFELQNGNVLWTNSSGVWRYDLATQASTSLVTGGCYHLNLYGAAQPLAYAVPYGTGCDGLTLTANGVPTLGNANFALQVNNVPVVSPVGFVAFGTVVVNPGVDLTVIGMAGCFGYTNLDIGLFTAGPVSSGTSALSLAIPLDPTLTGAVLATQGASLSTLTALGLASSNGLRLVLGS